MGRHRNANPAYPDVVYVEGLIGQHTVNCMPAETLEAFLDHGRVEVVLGLKEMETEDTVGRLQALGIALRSIGQELIEEEHDRVRESYRELVRALDERARALVGTSAA